MFEKCRKEKIEKDKRGILKMTEIGIHGYINYRDDLNDEYLFIYFTFLAIFLQKYLLFSQFFTKRKPVLVEGSRNII